jgi:hypothetical protein
MPLQVTRDTTFEDFDNWRKQKPHITTIRIRVPNVDSTVPSEVGYRAIAELISKEPAIMGEPSGSLVEAVSSMVDRVEERFPD